MAVINFGERWAVRQIDTTKKVTEWTSAISYIATTGTANESHWDVWNYANTNGPLFDDILERSDLSVQQVSATRYYCLFSFNHPESEDNREDQNEGDPSEDAFTTVGGSTSVTHSLETVIRRGGNDLPGADGNGDIADGTKLDMNLALNVTDIETKKPTAVNLGGSGNFGWTLKRVFANPLPCAYLNDLMDGVWTTNDKVFGCFAIGEVLHTGVSGSQRGSRESGGWELVFNFRVNRNLVGIVIPDITPTNPAGTITFDKMGHEFQWQFNYIRVEDDGQGSRTNVSRPVVYVERMYDSFDYDKFLLYG